MYRLAKSLSTTLSFVKRFYSDESQSGDSRSPFQHDKDRILHSTSFRRLQYKTQVYVIHEGDLYRTRMTHSLEVAQIARGLAQELGGDIDLAEAIALAHDVGHAPFGHAGEFKLRELLKPYGLPFEHNVQSYRVVTELEERYAAHPGLNLTRATLEGIIRHQSYFDNQEDIRASIPANIREEVAAYLPPATRQPGLEAQIVNLADVIAYATHDLEDALTVGLIDWENFNIQVKRLKIDFLLKIINQPLVAELARYTQRNPDYIRENFSKMRVRTLSRLIINLLISQATLQTQHNIKLIKPDGKLGQSIREQEQYTVAFPPELEIQVRSLVEDLLYQQVYSEPRVKIMTVKAERILDTLFNNYMQNPATLPRITQAHLKQFYALAASEQKKAKNQQILAQVVADYIAGMTDKYAMDTYQLLTQAYEKVL